MFELSRNLFWAGLTELIVIFLLIFLKDDKRKAITVFTIGTLISGVIGFSPEMWQFIQVKMQSLPVSSLPILQPSSPVKYLVPDFQMVSLKPYTELSSPETNLGLTPGQHDLLDIPFDIGWKASTQCSHLPNQPESYTLGTSISNPTNVYLLIQAGWGLMKYDGKKIGIVRLSFSDGSILDTTFILGFNIRDWAWENQVADTTLSSPTLRPAWKGYAPDGTLGGMDILTIDIPSNQSPLILTSVQIIDLSRLTIADINPCIHLVALTVKYLR